MKKSLLAFIPARKGSKGLKLKNFKKINNKPIIEYTVESAIRSKIFTNIPLSLDFPARYGITEYCTSCTKCSDACPPKALPYGKPTFDSGNQSTIRGVKKWSANCEKCFGYWAKIKTDCAICMRVCPFNRDFSKLSGKIFWKFATGRLQPLALWWEKRIGISSQVKPDVWWLSNLKAK